MKYPALVVRLLTMAKSYISDPDKWIKGAFAKGGDQNNYPSPWQYAELGDDPYMCGDGACIRARHKLQQELGLSNTRRDRLYSDAIEILAKATGRDDAHFAREGIWQFNDSHDTTHKDVMTAFDLAIEDVCKIVQENAAKAPHAPSD